MLCLSGEKKKKKLPGLLLCTHSEGIQHLLTRRKQQKAAPKSIFLHLQWTPPGQWKWQTNIVKVRKGFAFLDFYFLVVVFCFFSTVDYWQGILKALPWQYTLSHKISIGIAHFWGGFCYHSSAWGNQAITLLNVDDSNYGFYFYKCYEYLRIVLSFMSTVKKNGIFYCSW